MQHRGIHITGPAQQGKKMYSPLEGSHGIGRNLEEGTVLSTFFPTPCGYFYTGLTPPISDFI